VTTEYKKFISRWDSECELF